MNDMRNVFCSSTIFAVLLWGSLLRGDIPSGPDLHRVFFADIRNGYALGTTSNTAIIFKTGDGGLSWQSVYKTKLPLYGMYFRSSGEGWVVGGAGTILCTSNGGKTWSTLASGTDEDLVAVTADSSGAIFVVGKRATVLKSTDSGETWIKRSVPAAVDLTNVASLPSGMLIVLGRDRLLTSWDSGASWTTHGPYKWDTLSGLAFANEKMGFLSSGLLFRTTDGGNTLTWLSVSRTRRVSQVRVTDAGTYLILGSAESGSTVHVPGERLPSQSTILKSTNMGKQWQPVFHLNDEQTHRAWLEDLFFIGEYGWAVGAEGTVIRTLDGGKRWQRSRVMDTSGAVADSAQYRTPARFH